ncbi:MAG: phosphoribosylformylglycinamidine synthase subunit PurL [Trueperaceae bacterium]|nr:phosphoribosylformylglycinamidine synthase subunit PurL [Trueperaceae bacterium]
MPSDDAATYGLSPAEFDQVVAHLGRAPVAVEAAMFGALWSEHCGYKNSRPLLRRLPTEGPQVLQGPGENAGVVDIGDGLGVAFKMESHNHPSAVEPFQGAATGVGGILRDIFAMGARPFAILDSIRFGDLADARTRYLLSGVVQGIAGYGNAIGVPTVGGEVAFHPCYGENPLVNVMALGSLRHEDLQSGTVGAPGNVLLYVGSKTGRDGLGGAVFASADLTETSAADRPAVQVGDPFMEKLLLEACLEVIERGLVIGVQDMGAAGLTSSVAEMAHRAGRGIDLDLDRVPRREAGMSALEVMLSESQERMMLAVAPGREAELLAVLERWELDAAPIGTVADHGRFRLFEGGELVGDMPVGPLNEAPTYTRVGVEAESVRRARERDLSGVAVPADPNAVLHRLLADPTIASKRAIFRQYDHQVMTNTVVLPGAGDAAVMRVKGTRRGVAATVDCNARYVYLEPRRGAALAVAEAARNLACVGARPLGVTDNLNFGNPTVAEVYHQMVEAVEGLREACLALDTPVTGGNVSLYNQYRSGDAYVAIHPTPTVGMVGVLDDVERHAGLALRRDGDTLYLLGAGRPSLGASTYLASWHGLEAGRPPELDLVVERSLIETLHTMIAAGLVDTAHDLSDGGLAVTLAEMAIAGGRGVEVVVPSGFARRPDVALFGEAASLVVIAVRAEHDVGVREFARAAGVPIVPLGEVAGERIHIRVGEEPLALDVSVAEAAASFEATIEAALRT